MFDSILDFGTSVYILWGIGLLGLILKMMANVHMKRMIKASGNMATTKRRALRIMRLKYMNGKSLGINMGSSASFVDKNVRSMRYFGFPLYVWRRTGLMLSLLTAGVVAGNFLYYDVSWRGSPEMVELIANAVCVCAFLMIVENIFLINNKLEILKANIRDYLDNVPGTPADSIRNRGRTELGGIQYENLKSDIGELKRGEKGKSVESEAAATIISDSLAKPEQSLHDIRGDNVIDASPHIKSVETDSGEESDEAVLNSFLREFFS